jgi:hypothetical protein
MGVALGLRGRRTSRFLVAIIQFFIKEPEAWHKSKSAGEEMGNILRLFQDRTLLRSTLVGVSLAAVGVVGFWASEPGRRN